MNITDERIEGAIAKASDAFWATFAAEFPEISSGDLAPLDVVAFDDGVERAARQWVELNVSTTSQQT